MVFPQDERIAIKQMPPLLVLSLSATLAELAPTNSELPLSPGILQGMARLTASQFLTLIPEGLLRGLLTQTRRGGLVTDAIDAAIAYRSPRSPIVHLDHGSQFISWAFSGKIKAAGLTPSVGSVGYGYDNAPMESFWERMQTELLRTKSWSTRAELTAAIFTYIEIFHNRQ